MTPVVLLVAATAAAAFLASLIAIAVSTVSERRELGPWSSQPW